MKKVFLWILSILIVLILSFEMLIIPWWRSKAYAEVVESAKQDEFVRLFGSYQLEFMGDFKDKLRNGATDGSLLDIQECSIAVYKLDDNVAQYIEQTKGRKEVDQYFNYLINKYLKRKDKYQDEGGDNVFNVKSMSNSILYFKKYKINDIDKINYSYKDGGIEYFDKKIKTAFGIIIFINIIHNIILFQIFFI